MKITTKVRYGLRALLQIAESYDGNPVPLSAIAESQEISRKYLEQLVAALRKADLVGSRKGVHGGYYLTREPKDISLWDVFQTLEGQTPLVECVPNPDSCERSAFCTTRRHIGLLIPAKQRGCGVEICNFCESSFQFFQFFFHLLTSLVYVVKYG